MPSGFAPSVPTRHLSANQWRVMAIAAVGLFITACEVIETTANDRSGPYCPSVYDPVCAESRGERQTFPNACKARADGWRIIADGQCRADYRDGDRRGRDYRDRDYRDYRDYRDDRGRDNRDYNRRDRDRYDNGTRRPRDRDPVVQPATPTRPARPVTPTRPAEPVQPAAPGGACPQVFEQVCGSLNGQEIRFPNRCELQRAGAIEAAAGLCGGSDR